MDRFVASTDVFVPPRDVYDFLVDVPGYARYSEYLERVERRGDGGEGTVYDVTVALWRLTRTASAQVTATTPPERIDWRLQGPVGARGAWVIDRLDVRPDEVAPVAPTDAEAASRVTLDVRYDPSTVDADSLDLPAVLSVDALVDRLLPVVEDEAARTVERMVADLEGEPRPVDLRVETDAA